MGGRVHACWEDAAGDGKVGWLQLRIPETQQEVWAVVVEEYAREDQVVRTLVLLTNVSGTTEAAARVVYEDRRFTQRVLGRIEHGYRFAQEQGLDVEDLRVQTLARMRRLHLGGTRLVLVAAHFVFQVMQTWPPGAVTWLRLLGGKLGLPMDRDGPSILLRGMQAGWQTIATLTLLILEPFPHHAFTVT